MQPTYQQGYTHFFRGKLRPPGQTAIATPQEAVEHYNALPLEAQRYLDGWFDARDAQRNAWKEIAA